MAYDISHDDTQPVLPSREARGRMYEQLAPLPAPAEHPTAEITAVHDMPPRMEQVGLALAELVAANQKWEQHGDWDRPDEHCTAPLYSYLLGMRPGKHNPLGNLRPFWKYQDKIAEVAGTLRYPHGGAS